jgi:D-isomer specific 2-hydroxyacid dehydrogenase, NAD binding domain
LCEKTRVCLFGIDRHTARAKIVDRDAVVRALESGQLAGYAGDVWFPQPPAKDHPGLVGRHDVDQRVAGTKLGQFALSPFKPQAQRIEVEPLERLRIGRAQHDVIDPNNGEGYCHWTNKKPAIERGCVSRPLRLQRVDDFQCSADIARQFGRIDQVRSGV